METKIEQLELHIGIEEYVKHLVAIGQKPSTVGTAKRSLALFEEALGGKKVISKIMPVQIANFFKSEAATMQSGKNWLKPRAEASILQIRWIVRGALVWWKEQRYLETVPVPKSEQRYLEPRQGGKRGRRRPPTRSRRRLPTPTRRGRNEQGNDEEARCRGLARVRTRLRPLGPGDSQ